MIQNPVCSQKHRKYPLNIVCLEDSCENNNLICSLCQLQSHQHHLTIPLQIYLKTRSIKLSSPNKQFEQLTNDNRQKICNIFIKKISTIQILLKSELESLKDALASTLKNQYQLPISSPSKCQENQKKIKSQRSEFSDSQASENSQQARNQKHKKKQKQKCLEHRSENPERSRKKNKSFVMDTINENDVIILDGNPHARARKTLPHSRKQQGAKNKDDHQQKSPEDDAISFSGSSEITFGKTTQKKTNKYEQQMKFAPHNYHIEQLQQQFMDSIGTKDVDFHILCDRWAPNQEKQYLVYLNGKFIWKIKRDLVEYQKEISKYHSTVKYGKKQTNT